ncbi:Acid phosphatase, class B-like [Dillenia turbinata]|uniref:Acid phosphatase, class B-like n=1 Tax=Dillenia turbinata TaxID=194707 RepID=A0AAN8YVY0_9MAGN
MKVLPLLFFLSTAIVASHCSEVASEGQIHLLRPQSGSGGRLLSGLSCLSWRLAVEANNIIEWETIPATCEGYVGHYMLGHQYRKDIQAVVYAAIGYAKSLNISKDGKDIWIFDIDETSLSNLPYYAKHGFGAEPYNSTLFNEWVFEGKAPALPGTLKLYRKIVSLGIKPVFLTGRSEDQRKVTSSNLKNVGYRSWLKLILKASSESGTTAVVYKSTHRAELEASGYRIVGNIGDQWSDILGTHEANRSFKLPDPMYYIS